MTVSRLFSKAAAFSAAIVISSVGFAHAAVLGGANVQVTGDVTVPFTPDANGMFFIEATGSFFAQSLIDDPDALSAFALSTSLTAGGASGPREFFDIEVITPVTSVNELLGFIGTDFDDVVAFGAPFVGAILTNPDVNVTLNDPIFGLFNGTELGLDIMNVSSTSNSIMGDYTASALLNQDQIGALGQGLEFIFGPIDFEPQFSFEFNAEIAPIPLPAAFPLLLSGVALLGFAGWRRKRA